MHAPFWDWLQDGRTLESIPSHCETYAASSIYDFNQCRLADAASSAPTVVVQIARARTVQDSGRAPRRLIAD